MGQVGHVSTIIQRVTRTAKQTIANGKTTDLDLIVDSHLFKVFHIQRLAFEQGLDETVKVRVDLCRWVG